ncbi:MAG: hypothetical protein AB8G86_05490 [Saprospiraceae bacterium]
MKKLIWVYFLLSYTIFLNGQVTPLPLAHSHNDYNRPAPLEDALVNGFTSVEADVLYIYGKLYVGHNMPKKKRPKLKTLTKQYLKPLYKRFKANGGEIYKGYKEDFYLWIDIKFEAGQTYQALRERLYPFREMLTYYENGQLHQGKVTVILSGDRPFRQLLFDDLKLMTLDGRPDDLAKNYAPKLMPFISENAGKVCQVSNYKDVGAKEIQRIYELVAKAKTQGKKVRLWATPEEEGLWDELEKAGVGLINTDDLGRLRRYLLGKIN